MKARLSQGHLADVHDFRRVAVCRDPEVYRRLYGDLV
jgi:hypothetical protein